LWFPGAAQAGALKRLPAFAWTQTSKPAGSSRGVVAAATAAPSWMAATGAIGGLRKDSPPGNINGGGGGGARRKSDSMRGRGVGSGISVNVVPLLSADQRLAREPVNDGSNPLSPRGATGGKMMSALTSRAASSGLAAAADAAGATQTQLSSPRRHLPYYYA
ncbi:hypothetical protein Vretimale_3460, partial [Volvox reticuliferus]